MKESGQDTLSIGSWVGASLQGDADARRLAASLMGKARTERKTLATRANIARINERKKREGVSEATKAKLREAQKARRKRERQEKIAAGLLPAEPAEKRKPGRPKTKPEPDADAPKKPRGRPKKTEEGTGT